MNTIFEIKKDVGVRL